MPSSGDQHPYGQQPQQPYQPPQAGDYQGFYDPQQQPQFGQQAPQFGQPQQQPVQGWEQQPKRGRPAGPKRRVKGRTGCLGILGLAVIIGIIAAIASSGSHNTSNAGATTDAGGDNYNPPASASSAPSSAAPSVSPSPTVPPMTGSEQSAVQDGQSYLNTEPGFSYQGLISQVEYDQFSAADATFAVNYIAPASDTSFWDTQAADDAKNYMSTEGGFSCGSMVGQLEYDQFTDAEAEYGASAVGLGSC